MCNRERQDGRCITKKKKPESRLSGRREVFGHFLTKYRIIYNQCTFKYSAIYNHFHILSKLEEKGLVNAMQSNGPQTSSLAPKILHEFGLERGHVFSR